jgi:hypothetical protein
VQDGRQHEDRQRHEEGGSGEETQRRWRWRHDQADAEWIVIRRPLRGHNDTPFGRPTPGRPIGRPGVCHPQGVFGAFRYYQLEMLSLTMVCLTVALACGAQEAPGAVQAQVVGVRGADEGAGQHQDGAMQQQREAGQRHHERQDGHVRGLEVAVEVAWRSGPKFVE